MITLEEYWMVVGFDAEAFIDGNGCGCTRRRSRGGASCYGGGLVSGCWRQRDVATKYNNGKLRPWVARS